MDNVEDYLKDLEVLFSLDLLNNFERVDDAIVLTMEDGSTAYRVSIWMSTLSLIKDFWICGIGTGSDAFSLVYTIK